MATPTEQLAVRRRRGYWVRRARERKGYTLQYVASSLGYSDKSISTVSRWEDGGRQVPSDKIEPLSRLLSLPPRFLVRPPLTDDERLDRAVHDAEALLPGQRAKLVLDTYEEGADTGRLTELRCYSVRTDGGT